VLSPISGNYYVLDVFTFEGDTPPAFEARTVGLPALPIDGSVDACCRACWDNTLNCLAWTFNPGLGQCTIQVATALVKTGAPRTAQCPNGWLPNGFILWHGFEIDTQELQTYAQRGPCLAYTHWNGF
jgi:hypothetical protein